ncbi:MAG: hypothetical protein ACKPKO_28425 [Candidatus Fonsibacter sp.]
MIACMYILYVSEKNRLSHFLVGGMIDPEAYLINASEEWKLDEGIEWQKRTKIRTRQTRMCKCFRSNRANTNIPYGHKLRNKRGGGEIN